MKPKYEKPSARNLGDVLNTALGVCLSVGATVNDPGHNKHDCTSGNSVDANLKCIKGYTRV